MGYSATKIGPFMRANYPQSPRDGWRAVLNRATGEVDLIWDEAKMGGPAPTVQTVADWEPTVTEVEKLFKRVQKKLNEDEEKRTGKPVNPDGAVPLARAIAATAILYNGWSYPSVEDLETEFNQFLLSKIYEDPSMNTNAESSNAQKQGVLHFTLVMLAGQTFGLDYQAELGAYERTASGEFQVKLAADNTRDWLGLPCPKMHKDWPAFDSVRAMFQAVMK